MFCFSFESHRLVKKLASHAHNWGNILFPRSTNSPGTRLLGALGCVCLRLCTGSSMAFLPTLHGIFGASTVKGTQKLARPNCIPSSCLGWAPVSEPKLQIESQSADFLTHQLAIHSTCPLMESFWQATYSHFDELRVVMRNKSQAAQNKILKNTKLFPSNPHLPPPRIIVHSADNVCRCHPMSHGSKDAVRSRLPPCFPSFSSIASPWNWKNGSSMPTECPLNPS